MQCFTSCTVSKIKLKKYNPQRKLPVTLNDTWDRFRYIPKKKCSYTAVQYEGKRATQLLVTLQIPGSWFVCVAILLGDTTSFIMLLKRLIGRKKNGWLDTLSRESSLDETAKWVGHSGHMLIFIGRQLRLLVTAAELRDCARSGAAVSQSSGSHSASWQAALKRSPKATRDTCNLSPL